MSYLAGSLSEASLNYMILCNEGEFVRKINIIGRQFGKLTVLEEVEPNRYKCKCDCGNYKITSRECLLKGRTKSCGCLTRSGENLVGKKFNRLTVIAFSHKGKNSHRYWKCLCDCGNETVVNTNSLKAGSVKSCGCLRDELIIKHNKSYSKLYKIWSSMKDRCLNKNHHAYASYGGRGISICDEWLNDFNCFYEWAISSSYKEGLSLDRIDNDGNYEPSNCRWATRVEQQNNRRTNKRIEYNGEIHTIPEWSKILNINVSTLLYRLHAGWSIEKVFNKK